MIALNPPGQPAVGLDAVPVQFRRLARARPESVAVAEEGKSWSYGDLLARASQVADALQARGLGAGDVVAVTGPRGFEVIAALLGIWFRGGVIVPLDPTLPRARRTFMLSESRARVVLSAGPAPNLDAGPPVLELASIPPDQVASAAKAELADDSAYIVFTSGSTGVPKGILGSHRGLAHFLAWQRETFGLSPADRVAHLTSLSFDVALRDLFLPLTCGAAVCVPPETLDLSAPWAWLARAGITRLHAVPSLAAVWLDQARAGELGSLRTTFFAGEPLTDVLVRRWRAATPPAAEVINLYGPTETTLAKCWYRVPDPPSPGVQPLGQPLPGVEILVQRPDGTPCAAGESGELVIHTPYRSRGYLRADPAARFRPRSPAADPDDLVYLTGDRGRRRADGLLEFLGRTDDQVKILGVRVEPQEVVEALLRHPRVRQAHVAVQPGPPPRLLAYVVTGRGAVPARELVAHLADVLPWAMMPQQFIQLDRLPLTLNGKVDRAALPAPADDAAQGPRNETEARLAVLWKELLGTASVAPTDNFFALGGHSLRAMQLATRVREQWGVALDIRHVFEHPTLEALAAFLTGGAGPATAAVAARALGPGPHPASFAQERLWFLSQLEPGTGLYHEPVTVRISGDLDAAVLQAALHALAARHPALRTRFQEVGGALQQVVEAEGRWPCDRLDLSSTAAADRAVAVHDAACAFVQRPFDLARAPPARALLIKESAGEHLLVLALHHAIFDGWSEWILRRDLSALYDAGARAPSLSAPPPASTYADFARWEREAVAITGPAQVAACVERLRGAATRLIWPAQRQRPARPQGRRERCTHVLSAALTAALRADAETGTATLFMRLLAGFQILLHDLTGQPDVLVAVPAARRVQPEFQSVLGCFINTLLFRARRAERATWASLLQSVRAETLAALAAQDAPFELVVAALQPQRCPGCHPLTQALFNVLPAEDPETAAGGLRWRRAWLLDTVTPFDLALYAREEPEGIELHLVFDPELFERRQVMGWLAAYENILATALADPRRPLGEPRAAAIPPRDDPPAAEEDVAEEQAPDGPDAAAAEETLARIWREVLGVPRAGRQDNFFALGGHSLLAVKLMSRIRDDFALPLPLRTIFEFPTIAEMATRVRERRSAAHAHMVQGEHDELSIDQRALWELHRQGRDSPWYNVTRAVRLTGPLDRRVLEAAVNRVVQRHAVLRSVYADGPGRPRARIVSIDRVGLEAVDLARGEPAGRAAQEQALIRREVGHRFDLTRDVPIRFVLARLNEGEHTLIVTAHHMVVDCWSLGLPFQSVQRAGDPWHAGILIREVLATYDDLGRGRPSSLPVLPVQFTDFAAWQNRQLDSGAFDGHRDFWRRQLAEAPRRIRLPYDFSPPAVYALTGARREFDMPPELGDQLETFRREHQTTLLAPLLSAYALALRKWSGESDLVIGTPIGNRMHPETAHLIGPAANALALRVTWDPALSGAAFVSRTRMSVNAALAHQEYPFARLIHDLGATGAPHPPVFQVRFALQQPGETAPRVPGLDVTPLKIDRGVTKFDLSLIVAVQGARLRGWCEYNTALFKAETIARFADSFVRLAGRLVREPGRRLPDLLCS